MVVLLKLPTNNCWGPQGLQKREECQITERNSEEKQDMRQAQNRTICSSVLSVISLREDTLEV